MSESRSPPAELVDPSPHASDDTLGTSSMSTPWTYFLTDEIAAELMLAGQENTLALEPASDVAFEGDATAEWPPENARASSSGGTTPGFSDYSMDVSVLPDDEQLALLLALPFALPPKEVDDFNATVAWEYNLAASTHVPACLPLVNPFNGQASYGAYSPGISTATGWPSTNLAAGNSNTLPNTSEIWSELNMAAFTLDPPGHDVQSINTLITPIQSHAAANDSTAAARSPALDADVTSTSVRSSKKRSYSESSGAAEPSASGRVRSSRPPPVAQTAAESTEDNASVPDLATTLAGFDPVPFAKTSRGIRLAASGYTAAPGQTWRCLFPGCTKDFTNWNKFLGHYTRCSHGPDVDVLCQFCSRNVASGCRPYEMKRHLTGNDGFPVCKEFPMLDFQNVGELADWLLRRGKQLTAMHLSSELVSDLKQLAKGKIRREQPLSLQVVDANGEAEEKKPRVRGTRGAKATSGTKA